MHENMYPDDKNQGEMGYLEKQGKPRTWERVERAESANLS